MRITIRLIYIFLVCGCSLKDYNNLNPGTTVFNQLIKGINDKVNLDKK